MQTAIEKKSDVPNAMPERKKVRMRKKAALHGMPDFALRLLEFKLAPRNETDATTHYRHD